MKRSFYIPFITLTLVLCVMVLYAPVAHAGNEVINSEYNFVMTKIMTLFAWLVGVSAVILDNVVYYTVVTMGTYVKNLVAVDTTWRILRDIANIMLIFGFLGAGIAAILNVDKFGWKTKMLPMLLVAAVSLNFSLFVCEAMIDGTNLVATQFYTQINGGQITGTKHTDVGSIYRVSNEGISSKLMNQLGLQTLYNAATGENRDTMFKGDNPWYIGFMGIILFMVTAFVMFSLAFILIARFVALIFFIIFSPIGFMGLAIPQMKNRADQWWKHFLEQIITAPVLLLLLYVALAVITDEQFLTGFGEKPNFLALFGEGEKMNLQSFVGAMLPFLVAIGLLLVVVIKAKSMSAWGVGWATKTASRLSGAKLIAGGLGATGRYGVGMPSRYLAKGLRNTGFGRTFIGRGMVDKLEKTAGRSFDVRNTALGGKLAGSAGLNMGVGHKGGYEGALKERVASYERARVGIVGSRDVTKEEMNTISEARAQASETRSAYSEAQREYDKNKAEVEQIESSTIDLNKQAKLEVAKSNLAISSEKLNETRKQHKEALGIAKKMIADTRTAVSEKGRKAVYQERLANKWGIIPVFGTAASKSAKKHVKEEKNKQTLSGAIENYMKSKASSQKVEKEEGEKKEKPPEEKK